jgi:hypothetical protein
MKTIEVTRRKDKVVLDDHLSHSEPLVLVSKPFLGQREVALHIPREGALRAVAWCRDEKTGMFSSPKFFIGCQDIPPSELLLFQSKKGYTLLLPLSPRGVATHIRGMGTETLQTVVTNSRLQRGNPLPCVVAVLGENLNQTLNLAFRLALELTGGIGKPLSQKEKLPSWLQKVGWGSGGCFGADVSHDQIIRAIWSLRSLNRVPSFVILEEGWQHIKAQEDVLQGGASLFGFDADPLRFPCGLKGLVEELMRAGVEKVGVWHPILGYRGGIHSQLAKKYRISPMDMGHFLPGEKLGKTFEFFNDWYHFLAKNGISFVIAGDQSSLEQYFAEPNERKERYFHLHAAMQAAAGVHFPTPPWHADCLRSENLYWWTTSQLAQIAKGGEEDVQGKIRDQLYNALWIKELMHPVGLGLNTRGEHAETYALFWALFGAPFVLSDSPGQHDRDLIERLILPGGRVASCNSLPELVPSSLFQDPLEGGHLCLAKGTCGKSEVVGAFHVSLKDTPLSESWKVEGSVAIWSAISGWQGFFDHGDLFWINLMPKKGDLFTFVPVVQNVAVIGTPTLFLPQATVKNVEVEEEEATFWMEVTGPVVVATSRPILEVRRDGKVVPWDFDRKRGLLTIEPAIAVSQQEALYHLIFEG